MNVGGPAFLIKELMLGIDQSLFDQVLVYGMCEGKETEISGVTSLGKTYYLPTLKRRISLFGDFRALMSLRRLIRLEKPDLIDTHTFKAGFLIRAIYLFSRKKNIKITHHFHGHLLNGYFSKKTLFVYKQIEVLLARKADVMITDGDAIARDLVANKIASLDKFISITPGVSKPGSKGPKSVESLASSREGSALVVAFIGRLAPIKRPDRFLKVVEELTSRNVDCKFVIYGEGELYSEVQGEIARLKLDVNVYPFEADVYKLLDKVDILVMTSDNEGTPLTVMESSFAGVPCVGTNVGSMNQIIKDGVNGYLIEPEVDLLANKIEDLLKDESAFLSLKETSKIYAQDHFDIRQYIDAHQELYTSLIKSGRTSFK